MSFTALSLFKLQNELVSVENRTVALHMGEAWFLKYPADFIL